MTLNNSMLITPMPLPKPRGRGSNMGQFSAEKPVAPGSALSGNQQGGDRVAVVGARGSRVNGSSLLGGLHPLGGRLAALPFLSGAFAIFARQPKPALHGFNARADVELLLD